MIYDRSISQQGSTLMTAVSINFFCRIGFFAGGPERRVLLPPQKVRRQLRRHQLPRAAAHGRDRGPREGRDGVHQADRGAGASTGRGAGAVEGEAHHRGGAGDSHDMNKETRALARYQTWLSRKTYNFTIDTNERHNPRPTQPHGRLG